MDIAEANDQGIVDALYRHVRLKPHATAYQCGDRVLTFLELHRASNQVAQALAAMQVQPGDRVASLTKHHLDCLLLTLGACKLGAVCMPVNWRLAPEELGYIMAHGQAKLVVVDGAFAEGVAALSGAGGGAPGAAAPKLLCTEGPSGGFDGFTAWYSAYSDQFEARPAQPDDAALQLYSSGTTGLPKGVVLTHRGLMSTSRTVAQHWGFGAQGVMANPLPTFHVAGMTMLMLTLFTGGKTVAYGDFVPAVFLDGVARYGITHSFVVPAMLLFMLQTPGARQRDYRTLRVIAYGGSPISDRVLQDSMALFQCDFLQVYGLTEVTGPATFLNEQDHRDAATRPELLRSAGRPVGGARLRIVDPVSCEDLPEGGTGEVWIETVRNFKEYWRDPKATLAAFPEGRNALGGWFRTGDGGYLKDGYLYIHDRIKDMIISGGENIYPAEIENLLMRHPAVADGAIIGVPDVTWGEAVKACVVLKPGAQLTERELMDWMRERMAHFKCPKSIDFVDAMPRNPTGKLLKRVLRQPYWQGLEREIN
jgi:acyl-CoA synthetase (AMP-forming)/AMP-acid ligase II